MFDAYLTQEEIRALQVAEAASDKKQKRTPEQIEAIYLHGQNILVSASAGSGKTFVLVERIVDMLQRGIAIKQLFISTFTVKAASELKERLEDKLTSLIQTTDSPEHRQHLSLQLSEVQTADIGTMDAFTQKLVKDYGYLLGISPQFRILQDETEKDLLKQEVFDDLFESYMTGSDVQLFKALVKNFVGNAKTVDRFKDQIYQIENFLQSTSNPKDWLDKNFMPVGSDGAAVLEDSRQAGFALIDRLDKFFQHHLAFEAQLFPKAAYLDHLQTIVDKMAPIDLATSIDDLAQVVEEILLIATSSRGQALVNKTRKEETKEVRESYNAERKSLIEELKVWLAEVKQTKFILDHQDGATALLVLLRAFMMDFHQQYFEKKKAEHAFEFSDISHLAIQILTLDDKVCLLSKDGQEELVTVREFYQAAYEEVMVDEYQDTNHTQETMLQLLSRSDNRFMVGDIKQSIYRFRQADPRIFNDKFHTYQTDPSQGKLILLKENFRSQIEVLEATNKLFERLMDKEVGEINYDSNHRLVAGAESQKEETPENTCQFLIYDSDQEGGDGQVSPDAGEIEVVAREIINLHNDQKVPFKDIALLVRSRDDRVEKIFDKHGIPLVSDKSQGTYLQSVDVMVMLDTLRAIDNPLKDYPLVALLKSPMFAFTEDELARLALQEEVKTDEEEKPNRQLNFYEKVLLALDKSGSQAELITQDLADKLSSFQNYLKKWQSYAKGHSLYDLIWLIYKDRLYYDYVGFLSNGERRQANLYALALRAHQFEQGGFKGLGRFIKMIDRILETKHDLADVELPTPKDAVSLMTIHKSKGLQFPYVFVLNAHKEFNKKDESSPLIISRDAGVGMTYVADIRQEYEADATRLPQVKVSLPTLAYQANKKELHLASLSELMRLLYVAMTRAEQKLYLVGKGSQEKLDQRFDGQLDNNVLPSKDRQSYKTFQDWILAVKATYAKKEDFPIEISYISSDDLSEDKMPKLTLTTPIPVDDQKDNRQTDDIKQALYILENVDKLNQLYRSAINLPTLVTPSQIKAFYQPVLEDEGMAVLEKSRKPVTFDWPQLGQEQAVTGTAVGSALHELMQRLPLVVDLNLSHLEQALAETQAEPQVKEKLDLTKILAFFSTDFGQTILTNADRVVREAPFAMLETDPKSGEQFVIRGIIDGFIHFEDKIILFDYKTDKYHKISHLTQRYQEQMALYAKALNRSFGKPVEAYLILLGGETVQVAKMD